MFSVSQYSNIIQKSDKYIYRLVQEDKLPHLKLNGDIYIIDNQISPPEKMHGKQAKLYLDAHKEIWNSRIEYANQNPKEKQAVIEEIHKQVHELELKGFKIVGYSKKSLYRKISDPDKELNRQTRDDKFRYRGIFKSQEALQKLYALAYHFFLTPGKDGNLIERHGQRYSGNVANLTKNIYEYVRGDENFIEIAAVPYSSLYRVVNQELRSIGLRDFHEMKNHYNIWYNKKPYVDGAFTNDIDFMDWIGIDDHTIEAKANIFNESTGKIEEKTIYSWFAVEMKTMAVIAYDIKYTEFNADDMKQLLMKCLMNTGRPIKGFLCDNGLAKARGVQIMLNKLGVPVKYAKPYHPKDKSNVERFFNMLKEESIAEVDNYIGGKHIEGRHKTLSLMPAETKIFFEELRDKIDYYVSNKYPSRLRERRIDGRLTQITVKDYFEARWNTFQPKYFSAVKLRDAYQTETIKKLSHDTINMGRKYGLYVSPVSLPVAFNNNKVIVKYNPLDMSHIDIYALEAMECKVTGWRVNKNELIGTLDSIVKMGNADKQRAVSTAHKRYKKAVAEAGKAVVELAIQDNIDSIDESQTYVNGNIKVIDGRKKLEKDVKDVLDRNARRSAKTISDNIKSKNAAKDAQSGDVHFINNDITKDDLDELDGIAEDFE